MAQEKEISFYQIFMKNFVRRGSVTGSNPVKALSGQIIHADRIFGYIRKTGSLALYSGIQSCIVITSICG